MIRSLGRICLAWFLLALVPALSFAEEPVEDPLPPGLYATFRTQAGDVTAQLYPEKVPMTVASFVGLAEGSLPSADSKPFFVGLKFHRVVPGFVVQGGDPLGTGEGGPGYSFPDEFVAGLRHDAVGVLSMANAGPDTNGSQFFFTLAPVERLDYLHSVFGRVVRGLDVLPRIKQGDTFAVTIVRVGETARNYRVTRSGFDALLATAKRATPPHFADPEGLLPTDPPREKALNAKLENFQRFTGHKLYARIYPSRDPGERDLKAGVVANRIASELGVAQDGVTAVYWADTDSWGLWLGEAWVPRFSPAGTTADMSLHERKQAFLKVAKARAEEEIAKLIAQGQNLTAGQKVKLQVDEVLGGLIQQMERAPSPTPTIKPQL